MAEKSLAPSRIDSFKKFLSKPDIKNQIMSTLPKIMNPERFFKSIFIAAHKNPKLLECTFDSIMISILQCAELGLIPIMGRAHLVPFKNTKKGVMECQFIAGYQGLVDLARRSGEIVDVSAHVVYEQDKFDFEYGTNEHLSHVPKLDGDRGKIIGAYCVWFYRDGTRRPKPDFMPIADIRKRKAVSKMTSGGPWEEWEDEMVRKTVIKWSSKLQPVSEEMMRAIDFDNQLGTGKQPLLDMDFGSTPTELPESEAPTDAEIDAKFNEMLPEDINEQILYAFIHKTIAIHNKQSAEQITAQDVKEDAIENMEYFIMAYEKFKVAFQAEQEKEKEKEAKPKRGRQSSPKKAESEPQNGDVFSKLKADKKLFPDTYRSEAQRLGFPLDPEELTLKNAEILHSAINAKADSQEQNVEF